MSGTAPLSTTIGPGNNYFASVGSSLEIDAAQTGGPPNGLFQFVGSPIGIRDVTDGTSATVAFGEWKIGSGNLNVITIPQDVVYLGTFPTGATRNTPTVLMSNNPAYIQNFQTWVAQCNSSVATKRAPKTPTLGENWAVGIMAYSMGNVLAPPNPQYPNCITGTGGVQGIDAPGMIGLSSYHPGGADVLMCDGSVRVLKDSINQQTLWAIGSRNQGEVVSADSY
jgi:prepilin-type processing-associated H-X9-DG protein